MPKKARPTHSPNWLGERIRGGGDIPHQKYPNISRKNTPQSQIYPEGYTTDPGWIKDQIDPEAQRCVDESWANSHGNLFNEGKNDTRWQRFERAQIKERRNSPEPEHGIDYPNAVSIDNEGEA